MPKETLAAKSKRAEQIYHLLGSYYPEAKIELDYETPFQLVIATVLSAQATDRQVNKVCKNLFTAYPDAETLAVAKEEDVMETIKSLGIFRIKSRNIIKLSQQILNEYSGEIPKTIKELTKLAGVGRKTANVVLGNAFNTPGITVDTHFKRISHRLKWTENKNPEKIEQDVQKLINQANWTILSHRIIFHGRKICTARKPKCSLCPINKLCSYPQ